MNPRTPTLAALVILGSVILASPSPAGQAASIGEPGPDAAAAAPPAPIGRFLQLGHDLYRAAQPDADGFRYLRDLGIKTVVSFRNDVSETGAGRGAGHAVRVDPRDLPRFRLGRRFRSLRREEVHGRRRRPPSGTRLLRLQARRGPDRVDCRIYRIARQGWDADRALEEASDRGMRWWYFPMRDQVRAFAAKVN